jgi:hypothetical protein
MKTRMKTLRYLMIGTILGLAVQLVPMKKAHAGRSCDDTPLTAQAVEQSLALAQKTHQQLEAQFEKNGSAVVILARAGQDLSKYQLRYSHLGIAYRVVNPGSSMPSWRIVHKLNECGSSVASLYKQGLAEFFLDNLYAYESAWVSLKPNLQKQLIAAIESGAPLKQMHEPNYNMLSYPWSVRYQQSNQWVLELIAYSEQNNGALPSRQNAQSWLKQAGYIPTTLEIGPLTRLGGMTRANITFDDHPNSRRFANKIDTVTVDSIFIWLKRSGLGVADFRAQLR